MKFVKRWIDRRNSVTPQKGLGFFGVFLCILSLGSGCTVPVRWEDPAQEGATTSTQSGQDGTPAAWSWQVVEPGVRRLDARVASGEAAARILVWEFDKNAGYVWELVRPDQALSVAATAELTQEDGIFLNGGYFHADGSPSGLVQVGGERWGKRQFDPVRSGFVVLGDRPFLLAGTATTTGITADILQSYPWIIRKGAHGFSQETGNYARRTFVGTDVRGRWYVGIVPDESVTLYQLGHLLQALPIEWRDALNLDGGPSSGLVARIQGVQDRENSFAPVAYVIRGRKRALPETLQEKR
ncbi:phosphodiester glycosidase family protein [Patescibacteria group bacterium]|nr:phosphodiester glycosidase family protein [Patescibacteria group bacterium]MDQ5919420.1 hypothetical protein [Patescibacteria group bacterium]